MRDNKKERIMLGAICGDIIGSVYEVNNIKQKKFKLFNTDSRYTDDTVMTVAISKACCEYTKKRNKELFRNNCIKYMKQFGRSHINAGYGGKFIYWLLRDNTNPYNSFGNGSAMRVSSVGWISKTLEEAEELAAISAEVTHNHPYGIEGAKAVAGSIWILLNNGKKEDVKRYIENNYYNLEFNIDGIRSNYKFDVSCQGSVPQAIKAFLEGKDYEDTIRNAISIGGDSDTIAAIAGSLAEAHFGIPNNIRKKAWKYLDDDLKKEIICFYETIYNKDKEEER